MSAFSFSEWEEEKNSRNYESCVGVSSLTGEKPVRG
jgi:hypothetical protein